MLVQSLVLIAQTVFLLRCGQTDTAERYTCSGGYAADMGNCVLTTLRKK